MHSKRGMSAVVTTLIIILLVIVAMGIVWVVVKNIIEKGRDEITLTGLTLDLDIIRATFEDDTLSVTVKRNRGEGNLVGINFVISDGDNSVVVRKDTNLAELGWETFTFNLSTLAVGEITSISVAPIFEISSGKEVTGEILDTTTSDSGDFGTGDSDYAGTPDDEPCIPTQTCENQGFSCGTFIDDLCGNTIECEACTGEDDCVNNICVPQDCIPLDNATACTNAGYECGILSNEDTCGLEVNCSAEFGTCSEQHPVGSWECVENYCVEVLALNSGIINNTWPPNTGLFFDSPTLTKEADIYYGHFVGFPDVDQIKCYTIVGYTYDGSVYGDAIVELALGGISLGISSGNSYEIWPDDAQGNIDCVTSISS